MIDFDVKKIPSTFKLCKSGYNEAFKNFKKIVNDKYERIIIRDVLPFFRRDIYFDSRHLVEIID